MTPISARRDAKPVNQASLRNKKRPSRRRATMGHARRLKEIINAPMAQSGRPGAAGGFHVKRNRPRTGSERPVGRRDPQDFSETTKRASKITQMAKKP